MFELITLKRPFNSVKKVIQFAIWEDPVPIHLLLDDTPEYLKMLIEMFVLFIFLDLKLD